jgi:short-subunit dehydrogenase
MTTDIIVPPQQNNRSALPYIINGLIEDIGHIFSRTNYRLIAWVQSQKELGFVTADFKDVSFMDIKLSPGNIFDPYYTEQIYRNLKNGTTFPSNYWDIHMEDELCEFSNNIETLETLSRLYMQYTHENSSGYEIDLTFVLSNPDSPLMAVYHGGKVMVYNFSD